MATFCLIHGAWHGGWCWERLMPELTRLGHHAVTMDLPSADADATFSDYADAVADVIADVDDEVVVVAHSLGGLTGPLIPARRPVRRLAFVCALLPSPGRAFAEQLADDPPPLVPGFDEGLERDEFGSEWRSFEGARRTFYADCD